MKLSKQKKNVPVFLIISLIVLVAFSINSGFNKLEENTTYTNTHGYVHFTTISSNLVHELQKERGFSHGYLASNGKSFFSELKNQRLITNKKIKTLKYYLKNFDSSVFTFSFEESIKELLISLSYIDNYRVDVDKHKLVSSQSMEYYTYNINILLGLVEYVVSVSQDTELAILTQSYIMLMKTKENAGIERAIINKVFSQGTLSKDEFYKFEKLVSAQEVYMKSFKSIAPQKYIDMLVNIIDAECFDVVVKGREALYAKNAKNEILSSIKEQIGYGGLIHDIKNYLIRGEKKYIDGAKKRYEELIISIIKFKSIDGITKDEIKNLNILQNTFLEYMRNIPKITNFYKKGGHNIHQLDKLIKVHDDLALKALYELTNNIYGSQTNWFTHATHRIDRLKSIEDEIAADLHSFIDKKSEALFLALVIQIIILVMILVIVFFLIGIFRQLIESEKRLNRAQENTKSASYEYHLINKKMYWSDEHYKLLEVNKERFKPSFETFAVFIHPDDRDIVSQGMEVAMKSKEISFFNYRIILYDQTIKYVKSSAEVTRYSSEGDASVIVGTVTDISHSKKLEQEIIDTQKDVIFTMGAIGETRSRETGFHVKRVAEYSQLLYLLNGASEEEAELLRMASPMHDIGKVGIPDNILNKPGKLTPGEWAIMQTHSEMGYEMLKNSDREILKLASTVALTHHEKYDGNGYPRGLIANEIPMVGRVTALADVFDALGSDRCYKTAWELNKILELIKEERAKHFDPELVDLFLENIDKFLEIRDRYKDDI